MMEQAKRLGLLAVAGAALVLVALIPEMLRAAPPEPLQAFDSSSAEPRQVEETTSLAVQRDYAHAWQSLVSALDSNDAELLDENFTGNARQSWQDAIRGQQQNGLSRHIIDHGHHVQVRFYSLDGSALEAMDTADLEIEYREGSKVLSSERIRTRYLVLLTPADNSWRVRILQELPTS